MRLAAAVARVASGRHARITRLSPDPHFPSLGPSSPTRFGRRTFPSDILRYRNDCAAATRRPRDAERRRVAEPFRAASRRCRETDRSRWPCAITATSSGSTTPTSAMAAASCSPSCARPGPAGCWTWHKGLGPDALVARRRRSADAEGRPARGAGHRHARGAGRADLTHVLAGRDGREAAAQRRAQPHPLGGADPAVAQPHPLRHLPAPRLLRPRRPARRAGRSRRSETYYPGLGNAADKARGAVAGGAGPLGRTGRRAGWRRASSTACSTPTT